LPTTAKVIGASFTISLNSEWTILWPTVS